MLIITNWNIIRLLVLSLKLFMALCNVEIDFQIYDEGCVLDTDKEVLQVALVVDNTWSNKDFVEDQLTGSTQVIMQELNSLHRGTEFALTTHANWPQSSFTRRGHELAEACYVVKQRFTNDTKAVQDAAESVKFIVGPNVEDPEENGVPALAFCAADEKIGWVRQIYDTAGRRAHRFMVLITDEWSRFDLPFPGLRDEFRGDGTDTCALSLPASLEKTRQILEEKDVNIIGVYFRKQTTHDSYVTNFESSGIGHRHCHRETAFTNIESFSKELSDHVVECVKSFLKCAYLDPPGAYNTLGL